MWANLDRLRTMSDPIPAEVGQLWAAFEGFGAHFDRFGAQFDRSGANLGRCCRNLSRSRPNLTDIGLLPSRIDENTDPESRHRSLVVHPPGYMQHCRADFHHVCSTLRDGPSHKRDFATPVSLAAPKCCIVQSDRRRARAVDCQGVV